MTNKQPRVLTGKQHVMALKINMEWVATYTSLAEASDMTGATRLQIKNVMEGKTFSTVGYIFRTLDNTNIRPIAIPEWHVHQKARAFIFNKWIRNSEDTAEVAYDEDFIITEEELELHFSAEDSERPMLLTLWCFLGLPYGVGISVTKFKKGNEFVLRTRISAKLKELFAKMNKNEEIGMLEFARRQRILLHR